MPAPLIPGCALDLNGRSDLPLAGLLAKNVNDTAHILNVRGARKFFASKLAPTTNKPFTADTPNFLINPKTQNLALKFQTISHALYFLLTAGIHLSLPGVGKNINLITVQRTD